MNSNRKRGMFLKGVCSRTLLVAFVFLLPLIFLPTTIASLPVTKMYFVYIATVVAAVCALGTTLRARSFSLPVTVLTLSGALVVGGYVVAGLFSQTVGISLFGKEFAHDSVLAILSLFTLLLAVTSAAKEAHVSLYAYGALMVSGGSVAVLHLLHLFVPMLPTFNFFLSPTTTTVGSWIELGLFSALMSAVVMTALQLLSVAKLTRFFLYVVLLMTVVIVMLVNATLAWGVLGMSALVLSVQTFVRGQKYETKKVSVLSLSIFLLCSFALAFGQLASSFLPQVMHIQYVEVVPSFQTTLSIAQQSLSGARAFVGVGPAHFMYEWALFRPVSVLPSVYWDVDFTYGFSLLSTFLVTTGLIGACSWVLFMLTLLWVTVRTLKTSVAQSQDIFLLTAGALSMWSTWSLWFVYAPGVTLITLTMVMTGLFLATTIRLGILPVKSLRIPMPILMVRALLILLVLGVLLVGFYVTKLFLAHAYVQKVTAKDVAHQEIPQAEQYFMQATRLVGTGAYYDQWGAYTASQLQTAIKNRVAGDWMAPEQFRETVEDIIQHYDRSISYDPRNDDTYLELADFYTSLVPLGVGGAYDAAKQLYSKALELKPRNPAVYLAIAELELARRNVPAARAGIDKAIELKENYIDAYMLLVTLELSQGSLERAVNVLRRATIANPENPFIHFQLGLLEYRRQFFSEAVLIFERAVSLNPTFQNAKYFLGLSYYAAGETQSAIRQFEELYRNNPTHEEIRIMLEQMRVGQPISQEWLMAEELTLPLFETTGTMTSVEGLHHVE